MKKTTILLATLAIALVSCNRSETIVTETPGEISFKAVNSVATKADIISGTTLPTNDWVIYVSANGATGTYFEDKTFKTEVATPTSSSLYKNYVGSTPTPIYWPVGGSKLDFLAYAAKSTTNFTPAWGATYAASDLTLGSWDTYADQQDVVWAVANSESRATTTALHFNHAQAQLIFKVKCEASADIYKVNSITIKDLSTTGDFVVDNTKVKPEASWTLTAGADQLVKNIAALTAVTTSMTQIGDALLIPQQDVCEFTINYKSGDVDGFTYTVNPARKVWEMGKTYIYEITFTAQEIVFTETVEPWAVQTPESVSL